MKHPECNDNEVFVTNIFQDQDWNKIGWHSKRKGMQAYTIDGTPISQGYPVFVTKFEITDKLNRSTDEHTKRVLRAMLNEA